MPYERELAAARAAAEQASQEILAIYRDFQAIADAPANISTVADHRAQEIILGYLLELFPDDAFCAEEATPTLQQARREGPRLWVIDPIDGTRGFARKNGEFSVMIALVEEESLAVGVVREPAGQRCTYAVRGEGCWRQDGTAPVSRCHVSAAVELLEATVVLSRSQKRESQPPAPRTIHTYSAGIKLALIARGEADVYHSTYHHFHWWDLCAGQILVEQSGGRVSDARGQPIRYSGDGRNKIDGVIASNGLLHEAALRAYALPRAD